MYRAWGEGAGVKTMGKILIHIIPAIAIGFLVQIILHELGHLIGGLITGWKFLYLQIYKLIIKREKHRLKIMIVGEVGYRCIMYPISISQGAKLYTMGGCIMNLISSIVGLLFLVFASVTLVMWLYIWSFFTFGIGLFIMNGIARIEKVCNDKACSNLLRVDKHSRLCHNAQLIIARHLMNGLSYSEIGEEIICLCPDIAENDIEAYQAMLEYYYYLDINNHIMMRQALNKIRSRDNISKELLYSLELELIYLELLLSLRPLDSLHNNTLLNSVGEKISCYDKNGDIHSLRVRLVYDAYKQESAGNSNIAIEILSKNIEIIKKCNCIYEGEKLFCINQLKRVIMTIKDYKAYAK
ncbi:MAG: hypothetical protein GX271_10025 [Clostridiales bacterium]|nr:hypothetical protein [Clostridiales bacterium]